MPDPAPAPAPSNWHPEDLPYSSALLSNTQADLRALTEKRAALAEQLAKLTRQFAAVDTDLATCRKIEQAILAVLPNQEGGAE